MSLNDIFSALNAWLAQLGSVVWNYPIPWDGMTPVMVGIALFAGMAFSSYVAISLIKQIFAPLPPQKRPDPK